MNGAESVERRCVCRCLGESDDDTGTVCTINSYFNPTILANSACSI